MWTVDISSHGRKRKIIQVLPVHKHNSYNPQEMNRIYSHLASYISPVLTNSTSELS